MIVPSQPMQLGIEGSLETFSIFPSQRPDFYFLVNKLSQFMHSPLKNHWKAVKRVFRYMKCIVQFVLNLSNGFNFYLHIYSDVDWAEYITGRASTLGFFLVSRYDIG